MADYKSMYYHLAGRMTTAIDILEATTTIMQSNVKIMDSHVKSLEANIKSMQVNVKSMEASVKSAKESVDALTELKEKLKFAQQTTEEIFMVTADNDDLDDDVDREE